MGAKLWGVQVHMREVSPEGEEVIKTGKLYLVDLAGSENVNRSALPYACFGPVALAGLCVHVCTLGAESQRASGHGITPGTWSAPSSIQHPVNEVAGFPKCEP